MVEGARLESVYTRKGIEGSNPSVSAQKGQIILKMICPFFIFLRTQLWACNSGKFKIHFKLSQS